ncbi:MAG: EAL domain-containing protein, partial [Rhizobacter sp.]|nr:EAL domain-containing protein [Burkholderiales bacterium]
FSVEYPCHSPTEERWFLMLVTPIADGRLSGAVVVHIDVSERKRAETGQREAQTLLHSIIENIPTAIQLKAVQDGFRTVIWNKASETIFGVPRASAIGRNAHELWPAADADRMHADDLDALSNGGTQEFADCILPTQDRGSVHVHLRKVALRDERGAVSHLLVVADDISQQRKRFEDLRRFRAAMDISGDAIVLIDRATMRYIDVNQTLCDFVGRTREELLTMTPMDLSGESRETMERDYDALIADNTGAISVDRHFRRKGGALIQVETRRQALHTDAGWIIVANGRDITERKNAEERIRRLNRVYGVLSGINALIVRVRDRNELFSEACKIAVDVGGFRMAWIGIVDRVTMQIVPLGFAGPESDFLTVTQSRFSLLDGAVTAPTLSVRSVRQKKAFVLNDLREDSPILFAKKRLEQGIHSMAFLPLIVSDEAVGVLTLYAGESNYFDLEEMALLTQLSSDIAFAIDHINKQERLDYLAYYDVLTGLANRSLFMERVAQYMRIATQDGRKLALFLMDLERFKNINDSLGRSAGDALLGRVAEWITQKVGDVNLLARVGADQFAVVLPTVKPDGNVAWLIERAIEEFLEHHFTLNDSVFRIGIKAGVAIFPDDGAQADTLFKHAEAALKKAKASGERILFYTQNMTEAVARKLTLETKLRQAFEKEEFVLHYQPKINLASGKLIGAEALIRWNDPLTGLVPPGHFIPILEETGLIQEVGRWALNKAVTDYLRWQTTGLSAVRVAVNVSPLQLRHRHFIRDIEQAIGVSERAAGGLELEITESVIMEDVKRSIASLQAIRALNVRIAIDDFGTGFSSLSYLAKLPVDTLKIDQSFIEDMTTNRKGLALVGTVIQLSHSLKLNVVAEGVETEEQQRLLRLLDCDEMQGFLISKPLPVDVFEARFLTRK